MRLVLLIPALFLCASAPAGTLRATVTLADGTPIADTVVIVEPANGRAPPPQARETEIVDQIDKQFVPYVKIIEKGSVVSFPNRDNIRHQVYSFSPAKRFELPLYAGTPAAPIRFDTSGVVILGCNIHDWMIGYIYVADTPWYGKTGSDGKAEITGLPAGTYNVRIWHPRMREAEKSTQKQMAFAEESASDQAWTISLKPDIRPRRAPLGRDAGYR